MEGSGPSQRAAGMGFHGVPYKRHVWGKLAEAAKLPHPLPANLPHSQYDFDKVWEPNLTCAENLYMCHTLAIYG